MDCIGLYGGSVGSVGCKVGRGMEKHMETTVLRGQMEQIMEPSVTL